MRTLKLLLFSLSALSIACESDVKGNLGLNDYQNKLVVNAAVSSQRDIVVQLSDSKGILDGEPYSYDPNAIVEMTQGDQRIRLEHTEFGRYVSSERVAAGEQCEVEVTSSLGRASAQDYIPRPVPFQSISLLDSVGTLNLGMVISQLTVTIDDPVGEANYYDLWLYQLGEEDTLQPVIFRSSSLSLDNEATADVLGGGDNFFQEALFTDALFNGQRFTIEFQMVPLFPERPVYVHMKAVSETYYNYLLELDAARKAFQDPFAEPVSVSSNIDGGLGIFGGYALTLDSVSLD